jgi:hypothetical protein
MFLAGGFSRLAIDNKAAGDMGQASSYGAAAASMIFIFTSAFGASWLTVPWYGTRIRSFYLMLTSDLLGFTRLKSSPWPFVHVEMPLALSDGVLAMDGW